MVFVTGTIGIIALAACALPARRATQLDPVSILSGSSARCMSDTVRRRRGRGTQTVSCRLFAPKRHHRIHLRRTTSGETHRNQRAEHQRSRDAYVRDRIARLNLEQQARDKPCRGRLTTQSQQQSDARQTNAASHHEPHHTARRCPERQSQPDFARPQDDVIRITLKMPTSASSRAGTGKGTDQEAYGTAGWRRAPQEALPWC